MKTLLLPKHGSLKQALKQALKHALKQALKQALMQTRGESVYSTGITAGGKQKYRSISGRQPYIVPLAHAHISMDRL